MANYVRMFDLVFELWTSNLISQHHYLLDKDELLLMKICRNTDWRVVVVNYVHMFDLVFELRFSNLISQHHYLLDYDELLLSTAVNKRIK